MAFLDIDNLQKQFGHLTAVSNFNLHVEKGEFISLLGSSGCGKTTALRMIAGFERPSSGSIRLNGQDITQKSPNQRNIGMVFQSYALFPNMTVADNVGFGLKLKGKGTAETQKRVHELLTLIQLPDKGKSYPYQLSGGQQQRVALARALAIEPEVLLLDEPLSALDAKIRVELRSEIRRIQQQLNMTTIYVTHDQEEALSLSDRIVVMNKGVIEQTGTPFEIYNYPTSAFTASFVGQLNILPVTVVDGENGRCELHNQLFTIGGTIKAGKNTAVKIALRPEELGLTPVNGYNQLKGTVESTTFLGAIVRLRVQVGNNTIMADLFNERHFKLPKPNEPVTIHFPPHACWVLESGS